MARTGVTREQVFEAAEALVLKGEAPTVVAVRSHLGGGSPNTITPCLAEWKSLHESKRPEALPPLPEPVEGAMRQVWGAAWKGAQQQLEGEREALATAREGIEKERNDMLTEITHLDATIEEAQGETRRTAEALETERRAHDQTRAEVREAKAIAAERDRRIEDQVRELADARRQGAEASTKVSRLEADVEHLRRSLEAAESKAQREAETRIEITREADGLKRELAEASSKIRGLEGKIEQQEQAIETARAQARKDAEIKADLTRERDQARADQTRALAEVDSLKRQISDEKKIIDASGKKVAKLETDLEQERQGRAVAEQAAAELRVQIATLTERATQIEPLRALLEKLQKPDQSKGRE